MSDFDDILLEFHSKMESFKAALNGKGYERMRDLAYEETKEKIIEHLVREIRSKK